MLKVLLVGSGGFLGSIARYLCSTLIAQRWTGSAFFPYGTFLVNIIGCVLIGLLGGLADQRGVLSAELRTFLLIGVLGGYTTFSSFGYETVNMLRDGQSTMAIVNVLAQVTLGLIGVWAGMALSRMI